MGLGRGEIDGVAVFWVTDGEVDNLSASLGFRTGMADETLPTSGFTHLVERLAARPFRDGAVTVESHTGLLETRFTFTGRSSDVAAALTTVCSWFAAPTLEGAAAESSALRAELRRGGIGSAHRALGMRFGAVGPGLVGQAEPGVSMATDNALRAVCARAFTTGNAVLTLSGPPPEGLTLPLPDGPRLPVPTAAECPEARPACYRGSGFTLSGTVPLGMGSQMAAVLLEDAIHAVAVDAGMADPRAWSTWEPVDGTSAVVIGGCDLDPHLIPRLADLAGRVVRAVTDPGLAEQTLHAARGQLRLTADDPAAAWMGAVRASTSSLLGMPVEDLAESAETVASLPATEVAEAGTSFARSLLIEIPAGPVPPGLPPLLAFPEGRPVAGNAYQASDRPAGHAGLTVGPEGLSFTADGHTTGARFEEMAGVFLFPDGARRIVRNDGWELELEPTRWQEGRWAVQKFDEATPARLWIQAPARPVEAVPETPAWWRRLPGAGHWVGLALWGVGLLLVAVVCTWAGLFVDNARVAFIGAAIAGVAGAGALTAALRDR